MNNNQVSEINKYEFIGLCSSVKEKVHYTHHTGDSQRQNKVTLTNTKVKFGWYSFMVFLLCHQVQS